MLLMRLLMVHMSFHYASECFAPMEILSGILPEVR